MQNVKWEEQTLQGAAIKVDLFEGMYVIIYHPIR